MKLTVQCVDAWTEDSTYEIGEGKEFKTWYWGTVPSLMDNKHVTSLIIKRWCHAGCRVEIPRERINCIQVETNEHTNETAQP